ncbi:MAG: 16S rRNA (cytosine(1402)-N(4))-methyltransferase RsmH [Phycisphaerae bacterium]
MERGASHTPVLRREVVELLDAAHRRLILDCTVGLGGHAESLLEAAPPDALLIGMDVDEGNLLVARGRLERFGSRARLFLANFSQAEGVLSEAGVGPVDAMLADLGVASSQIDDPSRGLSFAVDGPLDMRLDKRTERTAADLVNSLGETELADLIYRYGEERYSRRIARAIVEARRGGRIERTVQLAQMVASAMPGPIRRARRGVHPATRTFQALRIAVNDEMASLERLLDMLPRLLAVGGRAAVISFHSLEDRPVKRRFLEIASGGAGKILTKKPISPSGDELAANPRSRSAKLRGIERIS